MACTVARIATHCTEADIVDAALRGRPDLGMETVGFLMLRTGSPRRTWPSRPGSWSTPARSACTSSTPPGRSSWATRRLRVQALFAEIGLRRRSDSMATRTCRSASRTRCWRARTARGRSTARCARSARVRATLPPRSLAATFDQLGIPHRRRRPAAFSRRPRTSSAHVCRGCRGWTGPAITQG